MIETEHRGLRISYNDNSDEWTCSELDMSAPKLSTLRNRINTYLQRLAKAQYQVPVFIVSQYSYSSAKEAVIVARVDRNEGKVWIQQPIGGNGYGRTREQVALSDLVLRTPDVVAEVDRVAGLIQAASKLRHEADEALKALPRVTLADITPVKGEADEQEPQQ